MFTVNRITLAREMSLLLPIAESKGTIPVLSNVLMELDANGLLRLTATDIDVTLVTEIAAVGDPASFCLPLHQLAALAKLFEGDDVMFTEKTNGRIEIKCGKSKHVLASIDAKTFPQLDATFTGESLTVNSEALQEAISRVLPCVSKREDARRATMQGVNFETKDSNLLIVATNGHRLGVASVPFTGDPLRALIPAKMLKSFLGLECESVEIRPGKNQIVFECGPRTLTSRLLVGEFPNWQLVVPSNQPYSAEIPTTSLVKAIARISVTRETRFVNGTGKTLGGAKLTFAKESLTVETRENDNGQSEEPVPITSNLNGDSVVMGINPDYLTDFLARAGDTVRCELKDTKTQLLFTDGSFQYILVPMGLK